MADFPPSLLVVAATDGYLGLRTVNGSRSVFEILAGNKTVQRTLVTGLPRIEALSGLFRVSYILPDEVKVNLRAAAIYDVMGTPEHGPDSSLLFRFAWPDPIALLATPPSSADVQLQVSLSPHILNTSAR